VFRDTETVSHIFRMISQNAEEPWFMTTAKVKTLKKT